MRKQPSSKERRQPGREPALLPEQGRSGSAPVVPLVLLGLLVVGATLFAHWPALSAQAVSFDDEEAITDNYLIQHPGWESVGRFFGEVLKSSVVPGYYRPLTLTSLMLDWGMGGRPDNFRPFHRTSLALHVGSTLLLMLLCYQLFRRPVVAAMVGLLFGVHPLTVEPVVWVMERKTILAAFFTFASLCVYVRYARCGRRRWLVSAVLLYFVSLLAKPTGTPVPFMLLLLDYWPLQRLSRRALLEKIPFFALAGAFAVLAYICENLVNPLWIPAATSPSHLPLRLCWLVVFYLGKVLVPIHLSSVYQLPAPLSPANPMVLLATLCTVLLVVGLVLSRRWTPALWVGVAMFFLGLAPTMGLVGYSWVVASDKYVYLPAAGLVVVLGWLLERLWSGTGSASSGRRAATLAAVLLAAGLLTVGTRSYLRQWWNTDRLVDYMLSLAPDSPELRNLSGLHAFRQKDRARAISELSRALELQPSSVYACLSLALVHADAGDYEQAVRYCTRAIERWPEFPEAYSTRGAAYGGLGDFDREIRDCTRAIELRPDLCAAYINRSLAYRRKGQFDKAIADSTKALALDRNQPLVYRDRGNAYFMLGRLDEAIDDFTLAIRLAPTDSKAFRNRGSAYARKGDYPSAVSDFSRAIDLAPDFAAAYLDRATTYATMEAYGQAWADVAKGRQLGASPSPDFLQKLRKDSGRSE